MSIKRFRLLARVSSSNPRAIKPALERAITNGSMREERGEFVVEAFTEGESAKDLNRSLLSALRAVERRTRMRAEWTSEDGTQQRFFDYVLKKTTKAVPPSRSH